MGKFLEAERQRQARFKAKSSYLSETARLDGVYKGNHHILLDGIS